MISDCAIDDRQLGQRFVDGHDVGVAGDRQPQPLVDGDARRVAAALIGPPGPRVVDEQPPHHLRRHGEKMGPSLPVDALLLHQLQKGLVDERRRLQRVTVALVPHEGRRAPPQLVVDDGQKRLDSAPIAGRRRDSNRVTFSCGFMSKS